MFLLTNNSVLLIKHTVLFLLTLLAVFSSRAQLTGVSIETQVNSTTSNSQQHPSIAADSTEAFIVVWESKDTDSDGWGIYGQRYTSGGVLDGSEFLINTTVDNDQRYPDVAMDDNGDHVVVWMDEVYDDDGWGVYMQRYDNTNARYGSQSRFSSSTTGHQRDPKICMTGDGQYAMAWTQISLDGSLFAIYARYYLANGAAISSQIEVVTPSATYVGSPDIAIDPEGNFTVVWQENGTDGSGSGIFARQFDNAATALGAAFQVNSESDENQHSANIAMDTTGAFVVVWSSYGQDGDGDGIYAQLYEANGTRNEVEFQVANTSAAYQTNPSVTKTRNGDITIAWDAFQQDGSYSGSYIRSFSSAGTAIEVETRINTRTSDFQQAAAIIQYDIDDELITVWQDGQTSSTATHDGDDYGVYLQRYDLFNPLPADWLDFVVKIDAGENARLNWQVGNQAQASYFEILRSQSQFPAIDGKTVGTVSADAQGSQSYYFDDPALLSGVYYYQLRQIDFDGKANLSDIRSIQIQSSNSFSFIYPNPASDKLNIRLASAVSGNYDFQIINSIGVIAKAGQFDFREGETQFSISNLAAGNYFIKVMTGYDMHVFRFVKI